MQGNSCLGAHLLKNLRRSLGLSKARLVVWFVGEWILIYVGFHLSEHLSMGGCAENIVLINNVVVSVCAEPVKKVQVGAESFGLRVGRFLAQVVCLII